MTDTMIRFTIGLALGLGIGGVIADLCQRDDLRDLKEQVYAHEVRLMALEDISRLLALTGQTEGGE